MASKGSALSVLDDMFPTVSFLRASQPASCRKIRQEITPKARLLLQIPTGTIASVLREHNGNVESAIEALLNVGSPSLSREKVIGLPFNPLMSRRSVCNKSFPNIQITIRDCRDCRRPPLSTSPQMIRFGGMRSLQGRCRSALPLASALPGDALLTCALQDPAAGPAVLHPPWPACCDAPVIQA